MCCRVFSSMFIPGVSLFPQGVFCNVLQGVLFNVYTRCFLQCCYWMCSSVFPQGVSFPLPDVTPLKVAHVSLSRSVSLSVAALLQRVIVCCSSVAAPHARLLLAINKLTIVRNMTRVRNTWLVDSIVDGFAFFSLSLYCFLFLVHLSLELFAEQRLGPRV